MTRDAAANDETANRKEMLEEIPAQPAESGSRAGSPHAELLAVRRDPPVALPVHARKTQRHWAFLPAEPSSKGPEFALACCLWAALLFGSAL